MKSLQVLLILCLQLSTLIAQNTGKTYALVVGISDYKDPLITDLQFAERDALIFSEYLVSRAGGEIPRNQIKLFLGQDATVANVYNALDWIKSKVKDGDQVYFYFAGHGDVESSLYKLGFLLTYDSPFQNYLNNAIRIEDINNFANTLSTNQNDIINTFLITDACHSGKLAGSDNRGTSLVGEQLSQVQDQEIRIVSCGPDEKSLESIIWGGGRGVFSFYLINGMRGLADKDNNQIVTLQELKTYLETNVTNDVSTIKLKKQNPVIAGKPLAVISKVTEAAPAIFIDSSLATLRISDGARDVTPLNANSPDSINNFFKYFRKVDLSTAIDFDQILSFQRVDVPDIVLNNFKNIDLKSEIIGFNIDSLLQAMNRPGYKTRFNYEFAAMIHDQIQAAINLYLKGDETELEKRQYYNLETNNYYKYPSMIQTAMMLIEKDHYLYRILELKLHYFKGVSIRLKIPQSFQKDTLIKSALKEQLLALKLEDKAAYVQNELGLIYEYKLQNDIAKKYYQRAIELSPTWSIPKANLSGLFFQEKKFREGIEIGLTAKALLPPCQVTHINLGRNYAGMGNWLLAEEQFRKCIELNSFNYYPYKELAHVYAHNLDYKIADSLYFEANARTQGFNFQLEDPIGFTDPTRPIMLPPSATFTMAYLEENIDTSFIGKAGIISGFYWAHYYFQQKSFGPAKGLFNKLLSVDSQNPLVYKYLGEIYLLEKNFAAAEINLKYAEKYFLDYEQFQSYLKEIIPTQKNADNCSIDVYSKSNFTLNEIYILLGTVYQNWKFYERARVYFMKNLEVAPGYYANSLVWELLEKQGNYEDCEEFIKNYSMQDKVKGAKALNDFYKRRQNANPTDFKYFYVAGKFLNNLSLPGNIYGPGPKLTRAGDAEYMINEPIEEGVSNFMKVIELTKDTMLWGECYEIIGDFYLGADSINKAIENYTLAIQFKPDNLDTRIKLIDCCDEMYQFEAGLKSLRYLNEHNQLSYKKMIQLAKYEIYQSNFNQADQLLNTAQSLELSPMEEIINLKAISNLHAGKLKPALAYFLNMDKQKPDNAFFQYVIAHIYAQQNSDKQAIQWLKMALKNGFAYGHVIDNDDTWWKLKKSRYWNQVKDSIPMNK